MCSAGVHSTTPQTFKIEMVKLINVIIEMNVIIIIIMCSKNEWRF